MRIKVIANPKKDWAKSLAKEISSYLAQGGRHSVVKSGADATICIGGDGTILYANHKGRLEGTILGIGSDKSYICQIHRNEWQGSLMRILERRAGVRIMTLDGEVGGKSYSAINDLVVHATKYRVVELEITIGTGGAGSPVKSSFEGDGVIFSASIGSTGYAYSAGGSRHSPTERSMVVVPICPYKRTFAPKTVEEDSESSLTVGRDCAFIVDGVFVRNLKAGERLSVKKGKDMIFFEGVGRNV
jgi:NAD+ kinase